MRQRLYAGQTLRDLRRAAHLNQRAMAARLGVSVSYLSQLESDVRPLTAAVTAALATIGATLTVALLLAHHHRRAGFVAVDADRHVADHVLVDAGLTLQFGDGVARCVDLEHHVMRLAVLRDLVSEAAKAPGFGLDDLALVVFDNLGGDFRQRVYLRLCQICHGADGKALGAPAELAA